MLFFYKIINLLHLYKMPSDEIPTDQMSEDKMSEDEIPDDEIPIQSSDNQSSDNQSLEFTTLPVRFTDELFEYYSDDGGEPRSLSYGEGPVWINGPDGSICIGQLIIFDPLIPCEPTTTDLYVDQSELFIDQNGKGWYRGYPAVLIDYLPVSCEIVVRVTNPVFMCLLFTDTEIICAPVAFQN